MRATPEWVASIRRARGECERCGEQAVTEYAGTGEVLCWECCERAARAVR